MQYKPHRIIKPVAVIGVILIAISTVFLIMANFGLGFLWLNQLGAIASITAMLYLLIRYGMTEFVYLLPEERAHLTVKKLRGSLPQTVAELTLSPADRILPYHKETLKNERAIHVENYCVSLFPKESYMLLTVINGKKTAIRLECKEDVAERIRSAIARSSGNENEETL